MLSELLLAAAFQIGPFYEQKEDAAALRPFWSREGQTTDVVWPLFTSHRDWWRFAFFVHHQTNDKGYQFEVMPLWWHGRESTEGDDGFYWGLFPLYGSHPHFLMMHDLKFVLWPVWTSYSTPRPSKGEWMRTNSVLWPFIHWRGDGSWGFWPFYVQNHQRESFHQTALWPIFTWASYEADRDTAGAGTSGMFWPLWGDVSRERESQWSFLPPLFSRARTPDTVRWRMPWPFIEWEYGSRRDRISVFPLYERVVLKSYAGNSGRNEVSSSVTRFGWKLVELYDDETRVFPFWTSRKDGSYFRLWPFWESARGGDGITRSRFLSLFPIRWVPAVDRNWAKFWTFYERAEGRNGTDHSLFWGIIRWRSNDD